MKDKKTIRELATQQILALSAEERIILDAQIATHIIHLPFWQEAHTVAAYIATEDEVDLSGVLTAALRGGKSVVLPRVWPKGREMTMHRVDDIFSGLERHPYGFLHPPASAPQVEDFSGTLLLVPGRGFDRWGNRVGRGAGYYDRFLSGVVAALAVIGVGYALQLFPAVPAGPLDRQVQIVITESESCYCTLPKRA